MSALWPLFDQFPRLAELPRAALRTAVTPVERLTDRLWIKRDDLTANPIGGNKVRALEFLLGSLDSARVVTAGSRGSSHVLSTAMHAKRLGIEVVGASWPQEMNPVAQRVDAWLNANVPRRHFRTAVSAVIWLEWRKWRGDAVIPAGGTSPLGMLGHVNAGLELAHQVETGALPRPARVVVPLGTGGTVAGLALGFHLGRLETQLIGVRVVPRIVARRSRIRALIDSTIALIGRVENAALMLKGRPEVTIEDGFYGGAYGRPLEHAATSTPGGLSLDPTYAAKAYAAATAAAREVDTLFWLTFDGRWMTNA